MKTRQIILCALFAALTATGIFVKIPIPGTPMSFTLQTFFIFLAGLLLEPKYAIISQAVYAAIGLLGLPVFMNGGGISYVMQPSFGFIIGFGVSAWLISLLVRKNILALISKSKDTPKLSLYVKIIGFALVSLLAMYVFGITYMYQIMTLYMGKEVTLDYLIFTANGIFILLDMLKFAIAIPISMAVLKRLPSSFSVYKKGVA